MRLAWFTPLAPASAIGAFSRRVAERLAGEADVTLWVEGDGATQPTSVPVHRYRFGDAALEQVRTFDTAIYNFGDYLPYHGAIYDIARRHRGVAILHDRVMHHLFAHYWLTGTNADEAVYLNRVANWYGSEAARRARAGLRGEAPALWEVDEELVRMPLYEEAIVNAEAVIVHSAAHAAEVASRWSGPVRQLDLPPGDDVLERARHRPDVAPRADGRLRALSVGHVNPNRHLERVLDMLSADASLAARLHVDVVGPEEGYAAYADMLRRQAAERSPEVSFQVHGRVGDAELERHLAAADIFINLRYPAMEGASASLVEQLAYGRPTLVFDNGRFGEVPADAVARVTAGDFAAAAVELRALVGDPARRAAIGKAARRFVETQTVAAYADGVLAAVEDAARWRPALRVLDRVGEELGDMGVADELGVLDRVVASFGPVLAGPWIAAEATAEPIAFRALADDDREGFRDFLVRNDIPAVTDTFDPFPMAAESADAILDGRVRDLYFGGFEPSGRMLALSMLRGWDEGFDVPSFGIVVDHAAQGRGLGKQMTAWTVERAREAGAPAVRLSVYDDNPRAVSIYERQGFAEVERHDEGRRARIVMRIELDSS